ncbi:hypothetical protein R5W24_000452 [Gemmata sp. JC717]|uniref:hypothetical protein n=1 Tax=Gemmata algarum TaxID=2975278 RepID=UPI0021BA97A7|nr:hypothetical protein [Gemmata algarum]MDY3551376.1 hypothetical protein [Gemmata algarum]
MAKASALKPVRENPPRKQVMLLSCMDLRFLDNTVDFMNGMNLQNRYDQVILAGSAMGAGRLGTPAAKDGPVLPWKAVFFHHLEAAINTLHREIKDIFLLEHLDCGAYKYLHPDEKIRKAYEEERDVSKLEKFHRDEAKRFAKEIEKFCKEQQEATSNDAWKDIHVRCLVMDLTGKVKDL